MTRKLSLDQIEVSSFVTAEQNISGGCTPLVSCPIANCSGLTECCNPSIENPTQCCP